MGAALAVTGRLEDKPPSSPQAAVWARRVPGGWKSLSRRAHVEGRENDSGNVSKMLLCGM